VSLHRALIPFPTFLPFSPTKYLDDIPNWASLSTSGLRSGQCHPEAAVSKRLNRFIFFCAWGNRWMCSRLKEPRLMPGRQSRVKTERKVWVRRSTMTGQCSPVSPVITVKKWSPNCSTIMTASGAGADGAPRPCHGGNTDPTSGEEPMSAAGPQKLRAGNRVLQDRCEGWGNTVIWIFRGRILEGTDLRFQKRRTLRSGRKLFPCAPGLPCSVRDDKQEVRSSTVHVSWNSVRTSNRSSVVRGR
jgi:hypothetical protein